MANSRTLPAASASAAAPRGALSPNRHRLRAVDRDEVVELPDPVGFLPPGATWLPAPQHTLPALPGRPPMVGYLVLVPADQQPALAGAVASSPHRQSVPEQAAALSADGPVRIDSTRRTAAVDGVTLDLTYLEFELLAHLVAHPHRVHTRDQLVTTVWGYGHVGDGRTVDVHVARLRRKLGAEHRRSIQTVRRVGYKYTP
ncbi:winged helix-turn-helix domain-containing protein [Streptomyces sp. NPDC005899]|uniref:winged helix-turn-helix domain-containing protein n=1 Tax=Streptomyces sp. NPDC005899 TaxID=3155716 RepID=UPI0033F65840